MVLSESANSSPAMLAFLVSLASLAPWCTRTRARSRDRGQCSTNVRPSVCAWAPTPDRDCRSRCCGRCSTSLVIWDSACRWPAEPASETTVRAAPEQCSPHRLDRSLRPCIDCFSYVPRPDTHCGGYASGHRQPPLLLPCVKRRLPLTGRLGPAYRPSHVVLCRSRLRQREGVRHIFLRGPRARRRHRRFCQRASASLALARAASRSFWANALTPWIHDRKTSPSTSGFGSPSRRAMRRSIRSQNDGSIQG